MTAALLTALLIAQSPSTQVIDSAEVGRVRAALTEAPVLEPTPKGPSDRPVFRKIAPPWSEGTVVPVYMRTGYPLYHYEFLEHVTPAPFRASALYPGAKGPEITPLLKALFTGSSQGMHRRQEASARKEVQQALVDLSRARQIR